MRTRTQITAQKQGVQDPKNKNQVKSSDKVHKNKILIKNEQSEDSSHEEAIQIKTQNKRGLKEEKKNQEKLSKLSKTIVRDSSSAKIAQQDLKSGSKSKSKEKVKNANKKGLNIQEDIKFQQGKDGLKKSIDKINNLEEVKVQKSSFKKLTLDSKIQKDSKKDQKKGLIQSKLTIGDILIGKRDSSEKQVIDKIPSKQKAETLKQAKRVMNKEDIKKKLELEASREQLKKGKRGKKICPKCEDYVPIHSQICKSCKHEFHMNHKPKTPKPLPAENFKGELLYSYSGFIKDNKSVEVILNKNRYYGHINPKLIQQSQQQKIALDENHIASRQASAQKQKLQFYDDQQSEFEDEQIDEGREGVQDSPFKAQQKLNQLQEDMRTQIRNQDYLKQSQPKKQLLILKEYQEQKIMYYKMGRKVQVISDLDRQNKHFNNYLCSLLVVEDGLIKLYKLPLKLQFQNPQENLQIELKEVMQFPKSLENNEWSQEKIEFCKAKLMNFGKFDKIAATDYLSNLYVFDLNGDISHIFMNTHSKIITDVQWMFQFDENQKSHRLEQVEPQPYLITCSMDGCLKIWDLNDQFVPIYEYFSSKKWVYQIMWDPTINAIFFNSEGKYFPQKILCIHQNQIMQKKFNFFSENILTSWSKINDDFTYSTGINGIIYQISKKDICRLLVKQKEKLKNISVKKILGISCSYKDQISTFKVSTIIDKEDPAEAYLFSENESAIVQFDIVKSKIPIDHNELDDEEIQLNQLKERQQNYTEVETIALVTRNSNMIFLINQ
eukprot:403331944